MAKVKAAFVRIWENTIVELDRLALKHHLDLSKIRFAPKDPDGAEYSIRHAKYNRKKAPLRDRRSDADKENG